MRMPVWFLSKMVVVAIVFHVSGIPECNAEQLDPAIARAYVIDGAWVGPTSIATLRQECGEQTHAVLLTDQAFSEQKLLNLGWSVVSRIGQIVTIRGCSKTTPALVALEGVLSAKTGGYIRNNMDIVRKTVGANALHGTTPSVGLPGKFTGRGVLVGVIDTEFDTHHPAFIDSTGKTRFVALWDQSDSSGAKRNSYRYGTIKYRNEIDADSMFGIVEGQLHGTHVASIAAGGQRSVPYYGIAPDALLIAVKRAHEDANIIDAIKWIFRIADSLRVPCVINMSLGSQDGPHDGTSLIDAAIDVLADSGRIIVGAAGNDGDMGLHLAVTFASTREKKGTWALQRPRNESDPNSTGYAAVDLWGESGKAFSTTIRVLDTSTIGNGTPSIYESKRGATTSLTGYYIPDTMLIANAGSTARDTVIIYAQSERASALNRKPHIQVVLTAKNKSYALGLVLSGTGTVHAWNFAQEPLKKFGMEGYYDGDSSMTINEIGGTAKRVVAVGSFTTKTVIVCWNGVESVRSTNTLYAIADYSSKGPTLDGRIKPDIAAPGDIIVAAMGRLSYDRLDVVVWPNHPQPHGRYESRGGTSSSAPVVAGVVALMLQAKPKLTPEQVLGLLRSTALKDEFTGALTNPDNRWGAGKVDALGAVSKVLGVAVDARKPGENKIAGNSIARHGSMLFMGSKGVLAMPNSRFELYDLRGKLLAKHNEGEPPSHTFGQGVLIVRPVR